MIILTSKYMKFRNTNMSQGPDLMEFNSSDLSMLPGFIFYFSVQEACNIKLVCLWRDIYLLNAEC